MRIDGHQFLSGRKPLSDSLLQSGRITIGNVTTRYDGFTFEIVFFVALDACEVTRPIVWLIRAGNSPRAASRFPDVTRGAGGVLEQKAVDQPLCVEPLVEIALGPRQFNRMGIIRSRVD
jgi:hypothetical protein